MGWLLKRWWFWVGTAAMLVALAIGYLLIPVEEPLISQATCDKIQIGWTWTQVEALLGEPTGYDNACRYVYWADRDRNRITVYFRWRDGTISLTSFDPTPLTAYERMRLRIERRIRALWP
jgi:hypothetical protein